MDAEVIVLGGGLAGLSAAHALAEDGKSVVLIEARDRLGGRAFTVHDASVEYPIELGPEWFSADGSVYRELFARGSPMAMGVGDHFRRTPTGFTDITDFADGGDALHRCLETVRGADRPLLQALDECCGDAKHAGAREMLLRYVEGFHAADPARLSLQWLMEVEENLPADASEYRSLAGLDSAIDSMAARLGKEVTLLLGTVARAVRWQRGSVAVDVDGVEGPRTIHAAQMIVTVPIAVLSQGGIAFTPPLDAKQPAFDGIATGSCVKAVLVFDEMFWQHTGKLDDALFVQDFTQPLPTWWTTHPVRAPVLTGWAAGPQADRLGSLSDGEVRDVAMQSLAHAFDTPRANVEAHLLSWHWHDWQRDPFAQGAYSWVASGGFDAHRILAAPLMRTLYFAGEATCGKGYNATMDGAAESGRRAATELLSEP